MFGFITRRYFHVSQTIMAATKSSFLAKLRKSTGYSVSNCKKALEMFPGDVLKAEEWLHAEAKSNGWAKWAKVQNRTAAQGLIGVCTRDNVGVMIEINCETDFVSRNSEFQEYVAKMLSGCMNFAAQLDVENDVAKEVLEESQLSAVKCEASTLGELLVAATCKFNEKTVAKRAVCLKVKDEILLNSLSHPTTVCPTLNGSSLGKYGVLLAAKKTEIEEDVDANTVGLNICQHIIGMNPLSLGELTEKDIAKFTAKDKSLHSDSESVEVEQNITSKSEDEQNVTLKTEVEQNIISKSEVEQNVTLKTEVEQNVTLETEVEQNITSKSEDEQSTVEESDDTYVEGQETVEAGLKDCNETQLMFQPYLLDPDVTVGENLFKSGLEILAFERFECGESTEEEPKIAQAATA